MGERQRRARLEKPLKVHAFHDYICQQLDAKLHKDRVVVFYDPKREFSPFFESELKEVGTGGDGLPRVFVGERLTFVARFDGSYFAVRHAVEPIVSADVPEPLIIYLAGVTHDHLGSVLMELEKAGTPYKPRLGPLARLMFLKNGYTEGQIDAMLKPQSVGYEDIVALLRQGKSDRQASVLRTLYDGARSEALLAKWLADGENDAAIADKGAKEELLKLIDSRLGLSLAASTTLAQARRQTLRYVLVSEFRDDLECAPPEAVSMVPAPASPKHIERIRDVAQSLRRGYADRYVEMASGIERELGLDGAKIDAAHLGKIDTFRFEERALLAYAARLITEGEHSRALGIVAGRNRSFWVDRDVSRQAQWEACRLMAELGREIARVLPAIGKVAGDPARWVNAYASEDGWFRADSLRRRLEAWVAKMEEDPEAELSHAVVRRAHEELLKKMAAAFASVLDQADWAIPGILHQTRIYPEVVEAAGGRVAYFFVDAMSYDMGEELARQLEGADDLTIRPAIAALPTITPVGMAALLPGASASFSVIEHKGQLAAQIEGAAMAGLSQRQKFLKAKVPDVFDITLGRLLGTPRSRVGKMVGEASLLVVRSQEIDAFGENTDELAARAAMDGVIGNVARAIRKLAAAGIEHFVVTADHGHQFSIRKGDDMKTESPGGKTIDLHRRCWIGHGGKTPDGTVRVSGARLGYDTDLDFVFPTGLGVIKAGGDLAFHHGGPSLQELVIPVVSLRIPQLSGQGGARAAILSGVPETITNRIFTVTIQLNEQLALGDSTDTAREVRMVLMAGGEQVGKAGMATDADFDRENHIVSLRSGTEATVGLKLERDDVQAIKVVALDKLNDAVLAETKAIPVKLGIPT